jgi:hypothetical protein
MQKTDSLTPENQLPIMAPREDRDALARFMELPSGDKRAALNRGYVDVPVGTVENKGHQGSSTRRSIHGTKTNTVSVLRRVHCYRARAEGYVCDDGETFHPPAGALIAASGDLRIIFNF